MPGPRPTSSSFELAARPLEDAFFLSEDRALVERLRAMRRMAETKESLAQVSGISNDAVLGRLVDLGVRPETLAALAAIPLVEVAWADGHVSAAEREAILGHANSKGIQVGSIEHDLLERWLSHKPEPSLLTAWQTYVHGLCEKLGPAERQSLKQELLKSALSIAEADGGFLKLRRISKTEQAMLDKLAASL